ncbi:hypothetical protein D910_05421 [Dendroctonus ponderosae]|uniref:Major facilitator superfamily (MFS) profile domain-containing protein n=1 Tax=Dendroctonus ponderosae TaxID=77166 RepID=U4U4N9_DENPD|nr:hypothetical protein D910_05421 [Dendroctonus ponderosae]
MQDTEYTKEESSIIAQGQKVRFGARHVQFIFIFGCLTLSIAMRASFSIAIVAMTDNKTTQNHDVPTYSWNNTSVMLSSFFWSYIIFQVFAGYVAKKYGPKYLLLSGSIVNALSFSLIPVSAKYASSDGVIAMRDVPVPWKAILTSKYFWSIVSANIGSAWGYAMMMTQIPTYLGKVMKFEISSNGVVSAIPYMAGAVTGFIFARLSDYLIGKNWLTTIQSRRTFQVLGSYGLVISFMILAYVSSTRTFAVVLLSLANIAYSATLVGYSVNHVDLSPRFAGILQGISNAISQAIAMFSPLIVHFLVKDRSDRLQWRAVFVIASGFYFICSTLYGFFSSATRQKWNGPSSSAPSNIQLRRSTFETLHSNPRYE